MNWIDVKKKLPAEGEVVLVTQNPKTTATKLPLLAIFRDGKFRPTEPRYFPDGSKAKSSAWSEVISWFKIPKNNL